MRESVLPSSNLTTAAVKKDAIDSMLGQEIDRFVIRQVIGEGGIGIVFVERAVALKIIKPGMDSRDVIARFQRERQTLAMMDHPNIARIYDAGTTPTGNPYFAMELVNGDSITDYCDERNLSSKQLLSLFVDVCRAVQHAHQKGIIHRDIKPSNVWSPKLTMLHLRRSSILALQGLYGQAKPT